MLTCFGWSAMPPGYRLDLEPTLGFSVALMTLRYRHLGGTGIEVSSYCLGTMMFGAEGNRDHDECARMIHTALDAGINFVDTADAYGGPHGEAEPLARAPLKGRRQAVVPAPKVHSPGPAQPTRSGTSRLWITRAVDDSLRRLQTDWIDLYQVHRPDPTTDVEETLSALTDLIHQGK